MLNEPVLIHVVSELPRWNSTDLELISTDVVCVPSTNEILQNENEKIIILSHKEISLGYTCRYKWCLLNLSRIDKMRIEMEN